MMLLKKGADVNVLDDDENCPIHKAAFKGHLGVVQILILNGANISQANYHRKSPTDLATRWGHTDILSLFRKPPANDALEKIVNDAASSRLTERNKKLGISAPKPAAAAPDAVKTASSTPNAAPESNAATPSVQVNNDNVNNNLLTNNVVQNQNLLNSSLLSQLTNPASLGTFEHVPVIASPSPSFRNREVIDENWLQRESAKLKEKPLAKWSPDDVCNWVATIGFAEYRQHFIINHISGQELFELDFALLKTELGVKSYGHRKQILERIGALANARPSLKSSKALLGPQYSYTVDESMHAARSTVAAGGAPDVYYGLENNQRSLLLDSSVRLNDSVLNNKPNDVNNMKNNDVNKIDGVNVDEETGLHDEKVVGAKTQQNIPEYSSSHPSANEEIIPNGIIDQDPIYKGLQVLIRDPDDKRHVCILIKLEVKNFEMLKKKIAIKTSRDIDDIVRICTVDTEPILKILDDDDLDLLSFQQHLDVVFYGEENENEIEKKKKKIRSSTKVKKKVKVDFVEEEEVDFVRKNRDEIKLKSLQEKRKEKERKQEELEKEEEEEDFKSKLRRRALKNSKKNEAPSNDVIESLEKKSSPTNEKKHKKKKSIDPTDNVLLQKKSKLD